MRALDDAEVSGYTEHDKHIGIRAGIFFRKYTVFDGTWEYRQPKVFSTLDYSGSQLLIVLSTVGYLGYSPPEAPGVVTWVLSTRTVSFGCLGHRLSKIPSIPVYLGHSPPEMPGVVPGVLIICTEYSGCPGYRLSCSVFQCTLGTKPPKYPEVYPEY